MIRAFRIEQEIPAQTLVGGTDGKIEVAVNPKGFDEFNRGPDLTQLPAVLRTFPSMQLDKVELKALYLFQ